jgi:hypothetical protein
MLTTMSAPTPIACDELRARIEARLSAKTKPAQTKTISPNVVHAPFVWVAPAGARPAARTGKPARPPMACRQKGFGSTALPHVELLDLSDDFLLMIVRELGVERDGAGAPLPHPETFPYGPHERDAEPFANSETVPWGDSNYIGYGGVWRCAIACTSSRFAAAVKATPASRWCAKMDRELAGDRALHAMRQPFFASPALVLAWTVDLAPRPASAEEDFALVVANELGLVEARTSWLDVAEDAVVLSVLRLARKGKIAHDHIAVYARLVLATFRVNQFLMDDVWVSRLESFQQTPSGGAVVLTCMEEVCTAARHLHVDPVVVRTILKRMQYAALKASYNDSSMYMRVPEGTTARHPRNTVEFVEQRTAMTNRYVPGIARQRIAWRQEIVEGLETVGRINGYLSDE